MIVSANPGRWAMAVGDLELVEQPGSIRYVRDTVTGNVVQLADLVEAFRPDERRLVGLVKITIEPAE